MTVRLRGDCVPPSKGNPPETNTKMNPLKNADAEKCAQAISEVINDRAGRQAIFDAFLACHPNLKNWEGQAIGQRAIYLARLAAEKQVSVSVGYAVDKYPNLTQSTPNPI